MRRRTIQLAKTDPRASHLAISKEVGSIHAPFSRSLYTIRIQSCTPGQTNIYIYIYTVRYEGKEEEGVEKGERNVRTRHFQVGTIESLSIWRRWIEITRDRNGRRKDWEVEMDGIERIRAREQSRKIVADSADLGAGDIWISTRRSWKPRKQASKVGIRFEFDKNSLDFSRHRRSRGSNAVSVNFSRPGSLKYERHESARRYGTYGETLNGT